MDWLTWSALILIASVLILDLVLISDAAYQMVREKPSLLGLERAMFKREPATADDCLRQGAGKLLTYLGILLIQLPGFAITLLNALGGPPPGERWIAKTVALVLMACAFLGLFLAVSSATVMSKVRYTYFGRTVKQR